MWPESVFGLISPFFRQQARCMPAFRKKVSLIYFVIGTLLVVGLVPLLLTGWTLSDKSAAELRAAENRYQIQLVQEKARRIEMFGRRFDSIVEGLAGALELSHDPKVIAAQATESKIGEVLRQNPDLLALSIKPIGLESLSVFRPGVVQADVEELAASAVNNRKGNGVWIGPPQRIASSGTLAMTFSREVKINGAVAAEIVAIASMQEIAQGVVGISGARNEDLWLQGLPIIFVVDSNGRTIFHPDKSFVEAGRPMTDLKIVSEWLESGSQVQSALVPFTAEEAGKKYDMIGAYSTARVGANQNFGVFTMQDTSRALALVGEMKWQTWMISLLFAVFALGAGLILSRFMTSPLLNLAAAAEQIAGGDFSRRVKEGNITEIGTLGESFNVMSDKIEEQIANLARAAEENKELFYGTVKALAAAIDGKDKYTRGHSERVSRISVAIGKRLGMPENELETLKMSALLHDIGKIAIDDAILKKPAALTNEEYEIMKTHPQKGYKIMSQIPAMKDFLPGMYMHHEMVNGEGYPQGLTGDQIPLQAKIVSVADTFDAMTIDRPYSRGMQLQAALARLRELVGTRYDGSVVEALVEACDAGEVANGIVRQMAPIRDLQAAEAAEAERHSESDLPLSDGELFIPPLPENRVVKVGAEEEELLEIAT